MLVRIVNITIVLIAALGLWRLVQTRSEITAVEREIASVEHEIGSIEIKENSFSARQVASSLPNLFIWRCYVPPGESAHFATQTPDSNGSGHVTSTEDVNSPWFKPDEKYPALSPGDRFIAVYVVCKNSSIGLKTITEEGHFGSYSEDPEIAEFLRTHLNSMEQVSFTDDKPSTVKAGESLKLLEINVPPALREEFRQVYKGSTQIVENREWRFMRFAIGSQKAIKSLKERETLQEQRRSDFK